MKDLIIEPIFSTPIFQGILDREFITEEESFLSSLRNENKLKKNIGNYLSVDDHLLDNLAMRNLKSEFTELVNNYVHDIYQWPKNNELYITQSWLNITAPGGHHHHHKHPNSIISGVFYVNVDEKTDEIIFHNPAGINEILPEPISFNRFNSTSWTINVKNKLLLLFPSTLYHEVSTTVSSIYRESISFNTFIKGNIGKGLSKLEL